MGQNCRNDDTPIKYRIRSPSISCLQCLLREETYEAKEDGRSQIHINGSHENIELLLRTVISANQLSIHGAIADLCNVVPKDLSASGKPAAPDHLEKMEIPTDLSVAENSLNARQRRNLVQDYERTFEQLSEDQKLSKLCSDAGLKLVEQGQYFNTLDTEEGQQVQHLCREYTMPRNEKGTFVKGWNTKVCNHDERYSTEVRIPSLFQDNTVSWVRIVNGVDKYVIESMLTTNQEDPASGKPIPKARPRQKPTVTLTSVSIPVPERKWIDIETQRSHDH